MAIYQVSGDTCVKMISKAGSKSMQVAFGTIAAQEISEEKALKLPKRVMYLRHPITRVNSVFNHFYGAQLYHCTLKEHIPDDIILAHGARYAGAAYQNEHHYSPEKKAAYEADVVRHEAIGGTREEIARRMDNEDYRRFIDHVLSGVNDQHWDQQIDKDGQTFCNVVLKFEDIGTKWRDHVPGGELPTVNSWGAVPRDRYRLKDLEAHYAEDLRVWRSL